MKRTSLTLPLLFLLSLAALHVNGRALFNGETVVYRYLPLALARDGTHRLDAFPHLDQPHIYTVQRNAQGWLVSRKTALPAVLMTPVYLADRLLRGAWATAEHDLIWLGKWAMSLFGAAACVGLALALRPLVRRPWLALAAGPGLVLLTPFWFPAQGAWVHPILGALNAAALALLVRTQAQAGPALWVWTAIGLTQGAAIACRIGSLPVAAVLLAAAALAPAAARGVRLRRVGVYGLGVLPPLAYLAWYNHACFGHPLRTAFGSKPLGMIRAPWEGVAGLLVSPGEGLLLFSPVLLLAALAFVRPVRHRFVAGVAAGCFAAHTLYWGCYLDWWGGSAWGPRYVAEAIPFALLLAVLGLERALERPRPRFWRAVCAGLAVASLAVQLIGMFKWDNTYHQRFDPGFWVNEGNHWAWRAEYEPLYSLRKLYWQTPEYWRR